MIILVTVLGLAVAILGMVGCFLPVIPGPLLSYLSIVILNYVGGNTFSVPLLVTMAILAIIVTALDYIIPAGGARRYGASRYGVAGSLIGMLAGMLLLPPFGLFIGAFAGAVLGELLSRRRSREALRAGWGVFVGVMAGLAVKLAYSLTCLFLYIKEMIY